MATEGVKRSSSQEVPQPSSITQDPYKCARIALYFLAFVWGGWGIYHLPAIEGYIYSALGGTLFIAALIWSIKNAYAVESQSSKPVATREAKNPGAELYRQMKHGEIRLCNFDEFRPQVLQQLNEGNFHPFGDRVPLNLRLHIPVMLKWYDVVEAMLKLGITPNLKDHDGQTPRDLAQGDQRMEALFARYLDHPPAVSDDIEPTFHY